jgi:hypothetical protein
VLSKINQEGKHLFLRLRPSSTVLANCSSVENESCPDFRIFVSNKNGTPSIIGWI